MAGIPTGTVTFIFTDIEGSTKLAREHPETWESARARHHAILREAIECYQGYVFQIIGDAFCAAFHTAGDALRAAAKSQVDLFSESWGDAPVKVRMGIHTGKAEAQSTGEYYGYLAMSRVQRLMSAGHGGQVLISAASQELLLEDVPENISLRDLGERRLKDLIRPEHVYQLVLPGLPVDFPPLKTLDFYRHNLPVQLTSFIGREKEMEEIKQFVLAHRLITLTGIGGTGKTRLSLQVAADVLHQFPQGVWFIDLAPLTDPELIPETILSSLGIPQQPGLTGLQQLNDYLKNKRLLLILDNCEHLIRACAGIVNAILSNSTELTVIATSREALGVPGELIWHVPSLSMPDVNQIRSVEALSQYEAVQLFIERAILAQPQFEVTNENAPAVAQICFRLDGIPLAIELAAARVRALGVDQIQKRLDDRFRLLTGGSRTALDRHQTLRAALDWSYNLLSDDEKLLLYRLSIFTGGWTLEAAEEVGAGKNDIASYDVVDLLTRLVDKSLVVLDGSRYNMLETTRQYAFEKLAESGELEWIQSSHLNFFMKLAEEAETGLYGSEQAYYLEQLETEQGNLRAALKWGLGSATESGFRLVSALWIFWFMHAHFVEGSQWFDQALSSSKTASAHIQMRLLIGAASNAFGQYQFERTMELSEQSLILAREQQDTWAIGMSLHHLGSVAMLQGDYKRAQLLLEEGLILTHDMKSWNLESIFLDELGQLSQAQGDYMNAREYQERALSLDQKQGNRWSSSYGLAHQAFLAYQQSEYDKAKLLLKQALTLAPEFNDKRMISGALELMGMIAIRQDELERAAPLIGSAESVLESIGIAFVPEETNMINTLHDQLGEATFEKRWAAGRLMTMDQAIAFALEQGEK